MVKKDAVLGLSRFLFDSTPVEKLPTYFAPLLVFADVDSLNLSIHAGRIFWKKFCPGLLVGSGDGEYLSDTGNAQVTPATEIFLNYFTTGAATHNSTYSLYHALTPSYLGGVVEQLEYFSSKFDGSKRIVPTRLIVATSPYMLRRIVALTRECFPDTVVYGTSYEPIWGILHTDENWIERCLTELDRLKYLISDGGLPLIIPRRIIKAAQWIEANS